MSQVKSLNEIYAALSPEALTSPADQQAFYRDELNALRGTNVFGRMQLGLTRAFNGMHFKSLLMGHPGVGKSTELARLQDAVKDKFQTINLSATADLDPGNFQPFDVLLVMLTEVIERTSKPTSSGGLVGQPPSDEAIERVYRWLSDETVTQTDQSARSVSASAGVSTGPLASLLGLLFKFKAEAKYAHTRDIKIVERRLSRLSELIDAANVVFAQCNTALRNAQGQEWLFVFDDFEKPALASDLVEKLFITYGNLFASLKTHLIFTMPVSLGYSSKASQLPVNSDSIFTVTDIPVYTAQHEPHKAGRKAVRAVIEARVDPKLFESSGQLARLIVASSGNIRDLFAMVRQAGDQAILRTNATKISKADIEFAINELRQEYLRRLGEDPKESVTYAEKSALLKRLYNQDMEAKVASSTLHSLLRARAVQEFNGKRWFGVHPIVVDLLAEQESALPENDRKLIYATIGKKVQVLGGLV